MSTNIGIIGQGFVGSAIREGLKDFYPLKAYDIEAEKCFNMKKEHRERLEELVSFSDIIFVCVPTPMRKDGSCDTRILEGAISDAYENVKKLDLTPKHSDFLKTAKRKKIFVIKSTIPPGTTDRISSNYPGISLCFSPEFLTEANSFQDFKNQSRIIIGGPRPATGIVKQMFRKAFPTTPIVKTGTRTAEMVKYFTNCFLATKVTYANQMYEICETAGIDYDKVCEYALYDDRIGKSHLAVPGPDGDRGFGGHCFPKDLAAIIKYAKDLDVFEPQFLESVERFNDTVRSNRDWEGMKGRAVSED